MVQLGRFSLRQHLTYDQEDESSQQNSFLGVQVEGMFGSDYHHLWVWQYVD